LRQTLVAFSNSLPEPETAVLFVGVDDKTGTILGVDDPEKAQMRIGDAGEDCYPAIRPEMKVVEVDGKRVLAVGVAHSKDKPHFAGPAYTRSGSRTVKAVEPR
jgi:predicted HTH transcriptional regulator